MIPRGLGALVAMPMAGRLLSKVQGRYLVAVGFLTFAISSLAMSRITTDIAPSNLFWPLFLSGFSIGFMIVPLNTQSLGSLKPEEIGNGSGIFNLMRNVGGSVGIISCDHPGTARRPAASGFPRRAHDTLRPCLPIEASRLEFGVREDSGVMRDITRRWARCITRCFRKQAWWPIWKFSSCLRWERRLHCRRAADEKISQSRPGYGRLKEMSI